MFRNSLSKLPPITGGALIGVSLLCASAQAQSLEVKTVPWRGDPSQQHQVWSTGTLMLQGVAVPAPGCALVSASWDPGDGGPPISVSVANPRVLETPHIYVGTNNQPFTAKLTVTDSCGNTVVDDFRVVVVDPKGLDVEINMAIDHGLWNLHKKEVLSSVGGVPTGYWQGVSPYQQAIAAATASSVQAMEVHGHRANGNAAEDPYVDDVARGLAHLPTELVAFNLTPQPAGNPDSNANGIGLYVGSNATYIGGQVIDAFVASGTPNVVTTTGPATTVNGRTYADIVQDILEMYAWGQSENGTARGGWRYSFNADSDNSACQWWAIGGIAAERVFGSTIPQWVKDENLNFWLAYSQFRNGTATGTDGSLGYGGPQSFAWDAGMNTTPSGCVQFVLDQVPSTDPRFVDANAYIARNWSVLTSQNRIYGMFATAKAMRLANPPVSLLASPGISFDWYRSDIQSGATINGLARTLVSTQQSDGSWDEALVIDDLATAWATIILSSTIVQQGPVAVAKANPTNTAATFPVVFNGAFSYHPDPNRQIVNYEWDFDHDGNYDATGVSVVHSFATQANYDVVLRVTDDTTPHALQSTASVVVHITPPPFPPSSNPGGPYVFCQQFQPWILDGTGSTDPDGSVVLYEWDFSPQPLDLSFTDAVGPTADVTAFFSTLPPGQYDAALRVTDNNGGTDVNFTTVRVLAAGDPCPGAPVILNCPPDFMEVWNGGIPAGQTDPANCGTATYTDNCTLGVQLTYQDISIVPNTLQNPGAPEVVVTRRWTVTDNCGHSASCDQTITLTSPWGQGGDMMLDVLPGSCPNEVWPTTGPVKIAIPGTWNHPAADIVPSSIKIRRADGVGVALTLANHGFTLSQTDVTRPYYGQNGPCAALPKDHRPDLVMTTSSRILRGMFRLSALPDNTQVTVIISGRLVNGESFSMMDWMVARH